MNSEMESSQPPITNQLTDIVGLRLSGIFPKGKEPSIATLRSWTKLRRIPCHKVGHFIYFDPADVLAHSRTKLRVAANKLDAVVVRRQRPDLASTEHDGAILPRWSHAGREPFKISNFKNPSGENCFRVSGLLQGLRIRRNFRTRPEAEAKCQLLEIQRLDAENRFRTVVTQLTNDQLREAEAAFQIMGENPLHTLLFHLQHSLAHHAKMGYRKMLSEAVAGYIADRTREHERSVLSLAQLGTTTCAMNALQRHFLDQPVSQFTGEQLLPFIERGRSTLKTYNNRRSLVSNFFRYAVQHGWAAENPVEKTPYYRVTHSRGSAKTISAERAAALMGYLETYKGGTLVPYFSLCLFAGVRPCFKTGEISKLQPESVMLDTRAIHIEPSVSKVRMKRVVTIQPNLAAWLSAYPLDLFSILPLHLPKTHREVFAKFGLGHDILRHTFISMFVGKFRSVGEAALQAGNSEDVIRKFYLDLKSPVEGERFFSILPKAPTCTADVVT
jgi:integrase